MNTRVLEVNCPTCMKKVVWSEASPWRPFCSQRCKLIDFGDWASERNSIPAESPLPDDEEDDNALR
jgi:endogenous inhibitor of DNA gyrase (YacG/DUF329 family)